jgi:hypothetical protein
MGNDEDDEFGAWAGEQVVESNVYNAKFKIQFWERVMELYDPD